MTGTLEQRVYSDRRLQFATDCSADEHGEVTNQSFKDECDINRVLDRSKHGASLSHLLNHGGMYGDFSHWDETTYEQMQIELARGVSIFNELPAELRANEFDNNPGKFFAFVNDPANKDRLEEIYPAMAAPGYQFPDVDGRATAAALASAAESLGTLAAASSNAPTDNADASQSSSDTASDTP